LVLSDYAKRNLDPVAVFSSKIFVAGKKSVSGAGPGAPYKHGKSYTMINPFMLFTVFEYYLLATQIT